MKNKLRLLVVACLIFFVIVSVYHFSQSDYTSPANPTEAGGTQQATR